MLFLYGCMKCLFSLKFDSEWITDSFLLADIWVSVVRNYADRLSNIRHLIRLVSVFRHLCDLPDIINTDWNPKDWSSWAELW